MGGCAAALVVSRKERRRGVNFPLEKRSRRVKACEGVMILVIDLASSNRGHSRMMWVGERVTAPQGHRRVSGGSEGRNRAA